jgi:hypothetical protein
MGWTLLTHTTALVFLLLMATLVKNVLLAPLSHKRVLLTQTVQQDLETRVVLSRILEVTQGDRALVAQFHNGDTLASGAHFLRMTCTHEVVQPGTSSMFNNLQGIPLSRLAADLALLSDGKFHVIHRHDYPFDRCRQHLEHNGIYHAIQRMIRDQDKEIGILAVHYCREVTPEYTPEMEDRLNELHNHITYICRGHSRHLNFLAQMLEKLTHASI